MNEEQFESLERTILYRIHEQNGNSSPCYVTLYQDERSFDQHLRLSHIYPVNQVNYESKAHVLTIRPKKQKNHVIASFYVVKTFEEFDVCKFFYDWGIGTLLQNEVFVQYNLRLNHSGLCCKMNNKKTVVCQDVTKICDYIGLNYQQWKTGFTTFEQVREWINSRDQSKPINGSPDDAYAKLYDPLLRLHLEWKDLLLSKKITKENMKRDKYGIPKGMIEHYTPAFLQWLEKSQSSMFTVAQILERASDDTLVKRFVDFAKTF